MKTSYKIITSFIIILFIALFTTGISLKAKYKKGDFNIPKETKDDVFTLGDLDKKSLGNFKHVVINGAIITKNSRAIKFNANLLISSGNENNLLGVPKELSSLLTSNISNDTLFIKFQKNNVNEDYLKMHYFNQLILQVKDLRSVKTKNIICTIESILLGKPFAVDAESSNLAINYIKTDLLTLNIKTNSSIIVNGYGMINKNVGAPRIDNLNYTLGQGSSISIANKELIGKINCLAPSKNIIEGYSKSLNITNLIKP